MHRHKHHNAEDEQKAREVVGLRGEAKTYSVIGALGAAGAILAESGFLFDAADMALDLTSKPKFTAKDKKMLLVSGAIVALGAIVMAAVKHSHADAIEATRHQDWRSRVENESKDAEIAR